eukprot:CAMPEP_0196656434 /NCGR_PEP_ID=MMETSP1086-20130531/17271_1 /TAXON_ID=77921 /ORGANISM="Cyanoptyche  gloeocystis , Strain SAG4.97" /LENGTH=73 /DNA_ID=CAMNT_0041989179 /DNA_START=40 /DNA_END=261 /DNA_ORIENTATION=+
MLRASLSSFLLGATVAGGAGYYQLHKDVWESASAVEVVVTGLKKEVSANNDPIARRVAALEEKVAKLSAEKTS